MANAAATSEKCAFWVLPQSDYGSIERLVPRAELSARVSELDANAGFETLWAQRAKPSMPINP
jgi:hypothetical protein